MRHLFSARLAVFRNISETPWIKWPLFVWSILAAYDTFCSQFLPEEWLRNAPKARHVIAATSGWFPIWVWFLVLSAIIVIGALEYAFRRSPKTATENPDIIYIQIGNSLRIL